MIEPWKRVPKDKPWRLGMKLHENGVGWVAIALSAKGAVASGTEPIGRDAVETIVARYRRMAEQRPDEVADGIDLYRYGSAEAFADSRAAAEGMSRTEHTLMIAQVAAGLRANGIAVYVKVVT